MIPKNNDKSLDLSSWMGNISKDRKLNELSIPGTHDSAAAIINMKDNYLIFNPWEKQYVSYHDFNANQDLTIEQQLNLGIRFFDIRASTDGFLYHKFAKIDFTFQDLLITIQQFFKNNKEETIIMRIKNERGEDEEVFVKWFENEIANLKHLFLFQSDIPSLGQARGKIWPLFNFNGLNYSRNWSDKTNIIQDNWQISDEFTIGDKAESMRNHIIEAQKNWNENNLYINHCSATPGRMTDLAEGIISFSPYGKIKQANSLKDVAILTNDIFYEFKGFVGIIAMDFPSKDHSTYIVMQNNELFCCTNY
jgi:1-phosphatidylinositol phosphodiesterase